MFPFVAAALTDNPVSPSANGILVVRKLGMSNAQQFICDVNGAQFVASESGQISIHAYTIGMFQYCKQNTFTYRHKMVYAAKKIIEQ